MTKSDDAKQVRYELPERLHNTSPSKLRRHTVLERESTTDFWSSHLSQDAPYIKQAVYCFIINVLGLVLLVVMYCNWRILVPFQTPLFWAVLCSIPLRYVKQWLVTLSERLEPVKRHSVRLGDYYILESNPKNDSNWYFRALFLALAAYTLLQWLREVDSDTYVEVSIITLAVVVAILVLVFMAYSMSFCIFLGIKVFCYWTGNEMQTSPTYLSNLLFGVMKTVLQAFNKCLRTCLKAMSSVLKYPTCATLFVMLLILVLCLFLTLFFAVNISYELADMANKALTLAPSLFQLPEPSCSAATPNLMVETKLGTATTKNGSCGMLLEIDKPWLLISYATPYSITRYEITAERQCGCDYPIGWNIYTTNDSLSIDLSAPIEEKTNITWPMDHKYVNAFYSSNFNISATTFLFIWDMKLQVEPEILTHRNTEEENVCKVSVSTECPKASVQLFWNGFKEILDDGYKKLREQYEEAASTNTGIRVLMEEISALDVFTNRTSATKPRGKKMQILQTKLKEREFDIEFVVEDVPNALQEIYGDLHRHFNMSSNELDLVLQNWKHNFQQYVIRPLQSTGSAAASALGFAFAAAKSSFDFVLAGLVFAKVLFLLLLSREDPLIEGMTRVFPFDLSLQTRHQVYNAFHKNIRGVFLSALKIMVYNGTYTWLTFRVFDVSLVYTSTLLVAFFSLLPVFPIFVIYIPGAIQLGLENTVPLCGITVPGYISCTLFSIAGFWLYWGDATEAVLREIPEAPPPYITALSVVGGLYTIGATGVVLGPVIVTLPLISRELYRVYQEWNVKASDNPSHHNHHHHHQQVNHSNLPPFKRYSSPTNLSL